MADEETVQPTIEEAAELRADYEALGVKFLEAEGSAAAAIARERRMIRARLLEVEDVNKGTVVDEVAARRESKATTARPPARRRQSR